MPLRFEVAGAPDAEAYRDLRLHALATNPAAYLDTFIEEYDRPQEEWAAALAIPARTVILGYTDEEPDNPVGLQALDTRKGVALFHGLYVRPGHRGSGYGAELINAGIDCATSLGAQEAKTHVLHRNERVLALLEACGFMLRTGKLVDRKRYVQHFGEYTLSKTLLS